jgi:hypothetical protein
MFGREARVDKSIIRIKSAHKWPEQVVFDTSQPTIVPRAASLAQALIAIQPREALGQLKSPLPKVVEHPAPARTMRKVAKQVRATRMAALSTAPGGPAALSARW